jgi:hypothetical protein
MQTCMPMLESGANSLGRSCKALVSTIRKSYTQRQLYTARWLLTTLTHHRLHYLSNSTALHIERKHVICAGLQNTTQCALNMLSLSINFLHCMALLVACRHGHFQCSTTRHTRAARFLAKLTKRTRPLHLRRQSRSRSKIKLGNWPRHGQAEERTCLQ